ncbi:PepSY domain-containing protein [Methylocella silvestris]|uniref:PepSY domain-containing protein n=1 Tax=Methylocella silvestris TaxID=199596 RepID=UPI001FDF71D0|nr:PepSY domain-containing protein [Methylocella silvestris]
MLVSALVLMGAGSARADQPGADWMNKDVLKKQLQAKGYSSILVWADDGYWEGEAIKDGIIVEFHADPHTGALLKALPKKED